MTSLKAIIAGKHLISAGLVFIEFCILFFYGKILQIYRQHWAWKFSLDSLIVTQNDINNGTSKNLNILNESIDSKFCNHKLEHCQSSIEREL